MKIFKNKLIYLLLAIIIIPGVFLFKSELAIGQYNAVDEELRLLNDQIQGQRKQMESLQKQQEEYSRLIQSKAKEQSTLENQLEILDNRFKKSELEIQEAILELSKNNLEIKKVEIDIDNKNNEIEKEKLNIAALLKSLHKQGQSTPLEILLSNKSLSDFINQVTYLENISEELGDSVSILKQIKKDLETQEKTLKEKKEHLSILKEELENKKNILEGEIIYKDYILTQTKESEAEYKKLLEKAKRENDQAMAEIASLEKTVREKLASKKDGDGLEELTSDFAWPVTKNITTAQFHDPSYPFRNSIGEHSGVDIRATQGSTLRATASGYVARVKFDGSTAYSYIMIIHGSGYSSVYGHISAVSVQEDEYVVQGQIIGKTGGAPRTVGAGSFSTGPHLHFEIRKNGIPFNPLNYLP